jgi:hypothetical protein
VYQIRVKEISNDIQYSECRDHPYSTSNEDFKGPRPAKRRKPLLPLPIENLTPPRAYSPLPQATRPDSATATQSETDNTRSEASHEHPPTPVDKTRDSRSSSTIQLAGAEADID